jgi:hypothetical protein
MPYHLNINMPIDGHAECGCIFVQEDPLYSYHSHLNPTRYRVTLCAKHSKEKYEEDLADIRTNLDSLIHQFKMLSQDIKTLKDLGADNYQGYCFYYP